MDDLASSSNATTGEAGKIPVPARKSRFVQATFRYPVPPADLKRGTLKWVFPPPEPSQQMIPPPTVAAVLERIAAARSASADPAEIANFLDPKPALTKNPLSKFPECQAACERLRQAKEKGEHILIYGDFDCDGVTAVTLMHDALCALGVPEARIKCLIPHRLRHGYNLKESVINTYICGLGPDQPQPSLLVAVDCGSTRPDDIEKLLGPERDELGPLLRKKSEELDKLLRKKPHGIERRFTKQRSKLEKRLRKKRAEVQRLLRKQRHLSGKPLRKKMDVIVIDHHDPDSLRPLPSRPNRLFHLNPKLWVERSEWEPQYQMDKMCAGGLTCLLAWALVSWAQAETRWRRDRALVLAGLATCVDVMELTGINRVLVKHSLLLANDPAVLATVPGLAKLRDRIAPGANSGLPVTEETYGFYWGPRVNAPGRMDSAETALELLMTNDEARAAKCLRSCIKWNSWRKATELAMLAEARLVADEQIERMNPAILTLCKPTWHPGVVGIVAARIRELYGRPTIIASVQPDLTRPGKVLWKGSGRSVQGIPMGQIFHQAARGGAIIEGGGHPMAGGLSFQEKQRDKLPLELSRRAPAVSAPRTEVVASAASFLPAEWAQIFAALAPFDSKGNPPPALIIEQAELLGVRVRTRGKKPPPSFTLQELEPEEENDKLDEAAAATEAGDNIRPSYWAFVAKDIKLVPSLLTKLSNQSDPFSAGLLGRMDSAVIEAMQKIKHSRREIQELQSVLAKNLNRLIVGPLLLPPESLNSPESLPKLTFRQETKSIANQNPSGQRLVQLNRLILEDVYAEELARREIHCTRAVWSYQGNFEDKTTGRFFSAVWLDLEEAETLWQVHRFLDPTRTRGDDFTLPHLFRLQLELRRFVPQQERLNFNQGRDFKYEYGFQIRQCLPLPRGLLSQLRMPTAE